MSLVKKLFRPLSKNPKKKELSDYFLELQKSEEFPYTLALSTYEKLRSTSGSFEEYLSYLLEDIIFSSIYATFYEHFLANLKDNPTLALELISNWEQTTDDREQLIGEQTQHHLSFVLKSGFCPGCPCCDNHNDVVELISYWQNKDHDFFKTLYIGMQTIQFSMEHLIYETIPQNLEVVDNLSFQNILDFRKFIFDYAEKRNS